MAPKPLNGIVPSNTAGADALPATWIACAAAAALALGGGLRFDRGVEAGTRCGAHDPVAAVDRGCRGIGDVGGRHRRVGEDELGADVATDRFRARHLHAAEVACRRARQLGVLQIGSHRRHAEAKQDTEQRQADEQLDEREAALLHVDQHEPSFFSTQQVALLGHVEGAVIVVERTLAWSIE